MSDYKFTRGPWEAERDDRGEQYHIGHRRTEIGQRHVATVAFGFDEPAETEQHANARLIAAAPELVSMLELIVTNIRIGIGVLPAEIEEARDIIARALGIDRSPEGGARE